MRIHWKHHVLYALSKRARAAYLILCFENMLEFYEQNLKKWDWLLENLWDITEADDIEKWLLHIWEIYDLLPEKMHDTIIVQEKTSQQQKIDLDTLLKLFNCICDVVAEDYGNYYQTPHTPTALAYIKQAEEILLQHKIPLPYHTM